MGWTSRPFIRNGRRGSLCSHLYIRVVRSAPSPTAGASVDGEDIRGTSPVGYCRMRVAASISRDAKG